MTATLIRVQLWKDKDPCNGVHAIAVLVPFYASGVPVKCGARVRSAARVGSSVPPKCGGMLGKIGKPSSPITWYA